MKQETVDSTLNHLLQDNECKVVNFHSPKAKSTVSTRVCVSVNAFTPWECKIASDNLI